MGSPALMAKVPGPACRACWPGEDPWSHQALWGQPPTWLGRKVQAAFSRAVITHGPYSRLGLWRILCAPEDSCVLQTPHYPRPGRQRPSASVITPAHAQQPSQGQEITPLPSPAFRRWPNAAPATTRRWTSCLPNGSLSSSDSLLSCCCLLSGDSEVWLSSWAESPKKDVTGTAWCACECMHVNMCVPACGRGSRCPPAAFCLLPRDV